MSALEQMRNIGQALAYYPKLTKMFGGVTASIFFSNILYWQPKSKSELGVYKTAEEITEEIGLSEKEQRTARKKLKELGVLSETYKRFEHKLYFSINENAFNELYDEVFPTAKRAIANCQKGETTLPKGGRELPKGHSTYSNTDDYLHTTTQSSAQARETSEKKQNPPAAKKPEPQPKRTKYTEGFEQFWFAYTHAPSGYTARTGGKPKAFEYWQKLHLESITDELVAKVNDFWQHDASWHDGYQPFAQKWLNQRRYEDEPQRPIKTQQQVRTAYKSFDQQRQDGYDAMRAWGKKQTNDDNVIEGEFYARH